MIIERLNSFISLKITQNFGKTNDIQNNSQENKKNSNSIYLYSEKSIPFLEKEIATLETKIKNREFISFEQYLEIFIPLVHFKQALDSVRKNGRCCLELKDSQEIIEKFNEEFPFPDDE